MSVVQGAVEFPDPVAQKNCFVILRRLTEAWGVKDMGPPGFVEFLYTQVSHVALYFLQEMECKLVFVVLSSYKVDDQFFCSK